ncbi:FAD-dependent oxidoreductase [Jongsikchunia kroppenstedtii]|uniref:FAD-dependent oxidoreductase n=1 Tax=Jongsikchunia kroppenstedtii TaxID=1121721 RepID=UPI00037165ED|nr:FAD-dependent oxidoreductase [Jongsikchunia kroppenstedtii]
MAGPMLDVLVIGAGPTGLAAALELARRDVAVRIIDAADRPFGGSRGKGVTARTQEIFDDLGVIDDLERVGWRHQPRRVTVGGKVVSDSAPDAGAEPTPDRPYPSGLILPQWRTEEILRNRLRESDIQVDYGVRAISADVVDDHVQVTTERDSLRARYVIGCDGGHSGVREWIGARFDGHGGMQAMYVGDVEVAGLAPDRWYQWTDPTAGFAALCPFRDSATWQFQGVQFAAFDNDGEFAEPSLDTLQQTLNAVTGERAIQLSAPTWMSRWRVNVRLSDRFREGRMFLAGDAAHVHSPAGGLGMNTGIQDAYNLGWKLAAVLDGRADERLLETYATERVPIAEWTLGVSTAGLEKMTAAMQDSTATTLIPATEDGQQLGLGYRWSSLSHQTDAYETRSGGVQAGDRAPDGRCTGPDGNIIRLFDAFRGTHAAVLGIGDAAEAAQALTLRVNVGHTRTVTSDIDQTRNIYCGSSTGGLYVVRPDGYIGFAGTADDDGEAAAYLHLIGAAD